MNQIQHLLNEVKIIIKKNDELLDATCGRFNIFKICGVNHYETTHSKILAEFLNPKGSHGLKDEFLKAFIEQAKEKFSEICFLNTQTATVEIEYPIENGRLDIFIEDDENHFIIIENKIYAKDGDAQLKRYEAFAKQRTSNKNEENCSYTLFYLTLYGGEASEQSSKDVTYNCISYKDFIIEWLEKCVCLTVRYPIIRETIIQYINHIKYLTGENMETQNEEELIKLLAKRENFKAAIKIGENINKVRDDIVKNVLVPQLQKIAEKYNLILILKQDLNYNNKGNDITFKNERWKNVSICFGFDGYN
jgi:hypothetical protein